MAFAVVVALLLCQVFAGPVHAHTSLQAARKLAEHSRRSLLVRKVETEACGGGGQPVCTGEALIGRNECDWGYVGEGTMCVPWTAPGSDTTGDNDAADPGTEDGTEVVMDESVDAVIPDTEPDVPTEASVEAPIVPPPAATPPVETPPAAGGSEFSGELTYYGGAGSGGACTSNWVPAGFVTVALNRPQYEAQNECGTCVSACFTNEELGQGERCFNAIVDNLCPECAEGDLDLGESGSGRWPVSWQKIPCPGGGGELEFTLQGSNASYAKIKAEQGPSSVVSMTCNGMTGNLTPDGFFEFNDPGEGLGSGLECEVTFSSGETQTAAVN